ncbi:MAG: hypothetical protein LBH03_02850 [Holophagales bacterium]|jgi:hypothetical protein|nr:hypothetical protein [Holophagales bacterium]
MKLHNILLATLTALLFLASAALHSRHQAKGGPAQSETHVYVAGAVYGKPAANGIVQWKAALWKDGVLQQLSPKGESDAVAVSVSGDDVYVGGKFSNNSNIWHNGRMMFDGMGNKDLTCMFVSGKDIYTTLWAYDDGTPKSHLWKNGQISALPDGYEINAVFVSGDDVYLAGRHDGVALFLKNHQLTLLGNGNANSIFVSGGDIYVAGSCESGAVLWKNLTPSYLPEGQVAESVFVSGNDVYVAGTGTGMIGAALWKNGTRQQLPHGAEFADFANSVFVHGNDVYVAGGYESPVVWKNGVPQKLPKLPGGNGIAKSVFVVGPNTVVPQPIQDVYAVTRHGNYYQWEYRYWKNGQSVQPFSTDGHILGQRFDLGGVYEVVDDDGTIVVKKDGSIHHSMGKGSRDTNINSLFVSGSNVYAGGREYGAKGKWIATVWKNGKVHQRLTDGSHHAGIEPIWVSGGDVYAAGQENNPESKSLATVWKNGKLYHRLSDGDKEADAFSICVSGGDIYAGGYEYDQHGVAVPMVWKNGKVHQRLSDGSLFACVTSLFLSGGDVYAGGAGDGIPTVWKNGEQLFRLGKDDGNVALVFVKNAAPEASASVVTGTIPLDGVGDTVIKYEVRHEGNQVVVMFDATGVRFSGYYSDAAAREGRGEWGMAEVSWELQGTSNITNADRTLATTYLPGNETMLAKVYKVKDPKRPVVLGILVHHSVTQ